MIQNVVVRAKGIDDLGDGLFGIQIEGRDLTTQEHEVLRRVFPNLMERAYDLIGQELLIAALYNGPLPQQPISPETMDGRDWSKVKAKK